MDVPATHSHGRPSCLLTRPPQATFISRTRVSYYCIPEAYTLPNRGCTEHCNPITKHYFARSFCLCLLVLFFQWSHRINLGVFDFGCFSVCVRVAHVVSSTVLIKEQPSYVSWSVFECCVWPPRRLRKVSACFLSFVC